MRGYVRITSSYRTHCPHCRGEIPHLGICWWHRDHHGILCESCYARESQEAAVNTQAAMERADREATA